MYVFVANRAGHAIAAIDMGAFAVIRHIPVGAAPTQVVSHPSRPVVYAMTPEAGAIHEILVERLGKTRSWRGDAALCGMELGPSGDVAWLLCEDPPALVGLGLEGLRPVASIRLPFRPALMDVAPQGGMAAISAAYEPQFAIVNLENRRLETTVPIQGSTSIVRFRKDGRMLLVGNSERRLMSIYEPSGRLVVHLPLAIRPERYCLKSDGGQMFLAGQGEDAVVTIYPFRTEVGGTTLAGHAPAALAASTAPDYLFVANPRGESQAGDVTILSIRTQRVVGVASVGRDPCHIVITPDNQYALVLNRLSGDVAVIRIPSLTAERRKMAALLTMIPVGSEPVSAAVRLIS